MCCNGLRLLHTSPIRWTQYPPQYQLPITDLQELVKPLAVDDPRRLLPIKAAADDACPHIMHDDLVNKLVNMTMKGGNKWNAYRLVMGALELIKRVQVKKYWMETDLVQREQIECNPVAILRKSIENCTPILSLFPVKRGGITYQVPTPITEKKARFFAMRWMLEASRDKGTKEHFEDQLAKEVLEAFINEGRVVKKKLELHKQCESNRAYSNYRWAKGKKTYKKGRR